MGLARNDCAERSIGLGRVVERASFDWLGFGRLTCEMRGFRPKGAKGGLAERRASFFMRLVFICSAFALCCGIRVLASCRGNRVFALLWTSASHLVAGAVLRGRVAAIAPFSDLQLAHSLQCVSAAGQSPQQVAIAFLRMTSREGASALRIVVWVACGGRRRT